MSASDFAPQLRVGVLEEPLKLYEVPLHASASAKQHIDPRLEIGGRRIVCDVLVRF